MNNEDKVYKIKVNGLSENFFRVLEEFKIQRFNKSALLGGRGLVFIRESKESHIKEVMNESIVFENAGRTITLFKDGSYEVQHKFGKYRIESGNTVH